MHLEVGGDLAEEPTGELQALQEGDLGEENSMEIRSVEAGDLQKQRFWPDMRSADPLLLLLRCQAHMQHEDLKQEQLEAHPTERFREQKLMLVSEKKARRLPVRAFRTKGRQLPSGVPARAVAREVTTPRERMHREERFTSCYSNLKSTQEHTPSTCTL